MDAIEKRARQIRDEHCPAGNYCRDDILFALIVALTPQWQPIETVPHGKWVYVTALGASCGGVAMLADYWINPDMRPDQFAERATHWMPLPDQSQLP